MGRWVLSDPDVVADGADERRRQPPEAAAARGAFALSPARGSLQASALHNRRFWSQAPGHLVQIGVNLDRLRSSALLVRATVVGPLRQAVSLVRIHRPR